MSIHVLYHEKYKNSLQAQIDVILIKSCENRLFSSRHKGSFKSGVCVRNERVVGSNPISGSNKIKASEKSEAFFLCIMLLILLLTIVSTDIIAIFHSFCISSI